MWRGLQSEQDETGKKKQNWLWRQVGVFLETGDERSLKSAHILTSVFSKENLKVQIKVSKLKVQIKGSDICKEWKWSDHHGEQKTKQVVTGNNSRCDIQMAQ